MNRKSIIGILMMKLLDLFSGIGGFSLGMEATKKIKTIAFCEKDEFCRKVLKKHWSNIKQYNDIRSINGKEIAADIVSGGFPCQPFSVAGKRKGTEDDRYLWDEMLRVITEVKPRWVVGENVQGIINIDNGLVLRQVQTDLEAQGFQVQCFIIPASGIGAWHRRNRVWILAHSNDNGSSAIQDRRSIKKTIYETQERENITLNSKGSSSTSSSENNVANSNSRLRNRRRTIKQSGENEVRRIYSSEKEQTRKNLRSKTVRCDVVSGKTENVSNSKSFGSNERKFRNSKKESGEERKVRSKVGRNDSTNVSNSNIKGLERYGLQSNNKQQQSETSSSSRIKKQQTWWEAQSELCGVPNGISYELDKDRANRIKALGNAIVPQIAYEIGQAILKAEYE